MHWWQDTKKDVIVSQLGTGKRLRLRLVRLGKSKVGEVGRGCQEDMLMKEIYVFWGIILINYHGSIINLSINSIILKDKYV